MSISNSTLLILKFALFFSFSCKFGPFFIFETDYGNFDFKNFFIPGNPEERYFRKEKSWKEKSKVAP